MRIDPPTTSDDAGLPSESGESSTERRFPLATPPGEPGPLERTWSSPVVRLAAYYLVLIVVATLLIRQFPLVRSALVTPVVPVLGEGAALITGEGPPASWSAEPTLLAGLFERILTTLAVVLGAVAVALPVAWVYMVTKRLRYDVGLVRAVVILPIAVAGILLVVKNSLAIAFSLAGIVAAVRFRNTLRDQRDAVFVFLTIAIGISAGVQALDVALVVSVVFNLAVLAMWQFQVGTLQGSRYGRTGVLSIGDRGLLVAQTTAARRSIRRQVINDVQDQKTDGILLVHTTDPEMARQAVQDALSETARSWRLIGLYPRGEAVVTAEYAVRLGKKQTAADLIGHLDDWSTYVHAAEFIPFRLRSSTRASKKPKRKGG